MGELDSGSQSSVVFTCERKPPSTNNSVGKSRGDFGAELERQFQAAGRPRMEGLLYGVIYWFVRGYRPDIYPDADNISKPVWDMLSARGADPPASGVRLGVYGDDKQVRLRVAGIVDLPPKSGPDAPEAEPIFLPPLPKMAAERLDDFIEGGRSQHFVYVECGPLRPSMFASGLLGERS